MNRGSLVLAVILTCQLMVVLDATIVNVALPDMKAALHFSDSQLSWVLNAYTLTFGGLLLLGARAGDLLGRRATFLTGIAIFTGASLVGGFATTGWFLLLARALQGVGGALAAPSSLALLATMFPEGRERMRALAMFTAVSIGGGAIGLISGGMLTQWVSWRWVLFVNVPIGLAVYLVGRAVLVETARQHGRFDLAGALTSTFGMTGLVYGFVRAASDGWSDCRHHRFVRARRGPAGGLRRRSNCAPRSRSRRCACWPTPAGAGPTWPAACCSPGCSGCSSS